MTAQVSYRAVVGTELDAGGNITAVTEVVLADVIARRGELADLQLRKSRNGPGMLVHGVMRGSGPGQWQLTERDKSVRALRVAAESAASVAELRAVVEALIDTLAPE